MLATWLQNRRIRKQSAAVRQLIQQGNTAAAWQLYSAELAPVASRVAPALRAAIHVQHWLLERDAEDLQSLRELASGRDSEHPVAQAAQVVERMHWHVQLSQALWDSRSTPPGPGGDSEASASDAAEKLALAVLATLRLRTEALTEHQRIQIAHEVMGKLPPRDVLLGSEAAEPLTNGCAAVYSHLFVWATSGLGQHERLCQDGELLSRLDEDLRHEVETNSTFAWGQSAIDTGRMEQASAAWERLHGLIDCQLHWSVGLIWGLTAMQGGNTLAGAKWLRTILKQSPSDIPEEWRIAYGIVIGLCELDDERFSSARDTFAMLSHEDGSVTGDATVSELALEARSQMKYLLALSHLAGTSDWPDPGATLETASSASRSAGHTHVENRILWLTVRVQLQELCNQLRCGYRSLIWCGDLLDGLIAFLDRNVSIDLERITRFGQAIGQLRGEQGRTSLKKMEATLFARAKATDEAVTLMRQHDTRRLREWKETILEVHRDEIRPVVRAAVYLTLWAEDPQYDPLPDLQRIPTAAGHEQLIMRCIEQVEATQTLHRLREVCLSLEAGQQVLPSLAPLNKIDSQAAALGAQATAVIQLRRGQFATVKAITPAERTGGDERLWSVIRFRVAWQQEDVAECRELLADVLTDSSIGESSDLKTALLTWALIQALENDRPDEVWSLLLEAGGGQAESTHLPEVVVSLVMWLLAGDRAGLAQTLVRRILTEVGANLNDVPVKRRSLAWVCLVLDSMVAAKSGQCTACVESAEKALQVSSIRYSVFGKESANQQILAWLKLFRLLADLSVVTRADDLPTRWRSVQRSLQLQSSKLAEHPQLQPYVQLVTGLLLAISPDTLVDDESVQRLVDARKNLPLKKGAPVVDQLIAKLQWRRRVIDEFWQGLRTSQFAKSRLIYQEELLPALGVRVPNSMKFAMILVDWDSGTVPPHELLHRLAVLQHDAADLNADFFEKIRGYLQDGEKVRSLMALLRAKEFDKILRLVDETTWTGLDAGSMPLPVAIAQFYAYFKLSRIDEAEHMGTQIQQSSQLAGWVRDYGSLLLGYVEFHKQNYQQAADAFAKTSGSVVLGHNIDRYWAAAQFSQGLQLLAVNQRESAFEAFARSLNHHGQSAENTTLAPLFIHFGLRSLDSRQGARAEQAFTLVRESLKDHPESRAVIGYRLLSDLGLLLCRALMDENVENLGGNEFLKLQPLEVNKPLDGEVVPQVREVELQRALHILAICQELRRELRRGSKARQKPARLHSHIDQLARNLAKILEQVDQKDPVLAVLMGVCDLLLAKGKTASALKSLEDSIRLGIDANKVVELVNQHKVHEQESQRRKKDVFEIFDSYLIQKTIPETAKIDFVRRDDLAELYRINRGFSPWEICVNGESTAEQSLCNRLKRLKEFVSGKQFDDKRQTISQLTKKIDLLTEQMQDAEKHLLSLEKDIFNVLAAKLRAETLSE